MLIGFVGSFSLWHGIEILQRAIIRLLNNESPCRLRFVSDGRWFAPCEKCVSPWQRTKRQVT